MDMEQPVDPCTICTSNTCDGCVYNEDENEFPESVADYYSHGHFSAQPVNKGA